MSDIIIELGSDRWTNTESGWYLECIAESGKVAYDGIPNRAERKLLEEIARLRAIVDAQTHEWTAATEVIDTRQEENERLRMLVLSVRDALNEYHLTKTENALDEVTRLAGMCNKGELLDVPYVKSVIEAETATLRRQLKDAVEVRDQRWQMAKDAKAAISRLTECDLESIDWDERTITLRFPAGIDGLEVRAGLKIRADLTPMQPDQETEPSVADQTYIL